MGSDVSDMKKESGLISLDFIAGFTVFLLALIIVISMLPGVFVNIHSPPVNYDIAAYRTGVLLAEDPGLSSDGATSEGTAWEQVPAADVGRILRLGLAVSKETPNVLLPEKIERFFNVPAYLNLTADQYRGMLVFEEYPVNFNISFKEDGGETLSVGDRVPGGEYGFSKRYVKVKNAAELRVPAENLTISGVDVNLPEGADEFIYRNTTSFTLSYANLSDRSVSPAYRIDPRTGRTIIKIAGIDTVLGAQEGISSAAIESVRLFRDGAEVAIPHGGNAPNKPYKPYGVPYVCVVDGVTVENGSEIPVKDAGTLEFILYPDESYFPNPDSMLEILFDMKYTCISGGTYRFIQGETDYGYDSPYLVCPYLTDGVLEVCIW
ncbi:MAG: hypothetical protein IKS74_03575 [Methanomicrobium sp.]|nr:hypothetical protein [Methanomicrobium sp.]